VHSSGYPFRETQDFVNEEVPSPPYSGVLLGAYATLRWLSTRRVQSRHNSQVNRHNARGVAALLILSGCVKILNHTFIAIVQPWTCPHHEAGICINSSVGHACLGNLISCNHATKAQGMYNGIEYPLGYTVAPVQRNAQSRERK